ncbi:hypothetical protein [Acinetobacter schindleri]|uniref:hypothetical protein n=1 Tax=Acinetobacter schindleri TaxID=108981 RepID=UPI003F557415
MQTGIFIIKKRPLIDSLYFWGLTVMLLFGWILQIIIPGIATNILEVLFLTLSLSVYLKKSSYTSSILTSAVVIILYILISCIYAILFKSANILDFIMAYKFTWYILLLLPFSNTRILDPLSIYRLLRFTLIIFLLVYAIKFIMGEERPTFFIENNFEILFLCFLFYANHIINKYSKMQDMLLLLMITVISGSRSGVMLALITVLFSTDIRHIIRSKNIFMPIAGFIGAIGAYFVFMRRTTDGVESIDRYRFYQYFLESIQEWQWWQFLLGAPRITKLPDHVCSGLAFYKTLLSFENNGSCYSVIFHSFNMRILFDHGILVILALLFILNNILKNRTKKEKIFVFLLLIINGMSVSSINSVYAALGIALIASIGCQKNALKNTIS